MKVQIKLFGEFRRFAADGGESPTFWIEAEEGVSLQQLISMLGIPSESPKTLVLNHRAGNPETVLQEGDVVAVFPPIAGGG